MTSRYTPRVIAAACLTALAWPSAFACRAADSSVRMEQIINYYVENHQFMGAVLVAKGNDILLDKGYGYANLEWMVPDAPDTRFRLGSLTKQFTAASILLLEERGKLKITDPVRAYIPDAPAAWAKITIRNLLTHTSGIPDFTTFPDYRPSEPFPATPQGLVARFKDKPLDFEPGERFSYSNSGYIVLGYILEKISGQSYGDFVRDNIFKPLGMVDSGYDSSRLIIPRHASGYTLGPDGLQNATYVDMSVPFAAGGLYSTTHDLKLWEDGLFGGRLLSKASLQKMTTPYKDNYALGLAVETVEGHEVVSHAGGIEGFNTNLAYYPEDRLTIAVLGNLNGAAPTLIGNQLAAVLHGQAVTLPSERQTVAVRAERLEAYAGSYELAPGFDIVVTVENGHLMAQATGQPKLELFAESETAFYLKAVDAKIEFVRDANGKVAYLMLHQGAQDIKGIKKG